jgi:hypothetical protein
MAERFTIYAGEPIAAALVGYEDNRSGRLNQIAADYLQLVAALVPVMTVPEWSAVVDALNSTDLGDEQTLKLVWASIADTDGLGDKWHVDHDALVARVRALTLPELIALREVVNRFWDLAGGIDFDHALKQSGARFAAQ